MAASETGDQIEETRKPAKGSRHKAEGEFYPMQMACHSACDGYCGPYNRSMPADALILDRDHDLDQTSTRPGLTRP